MRTSESVMVNFIEDTKTAARNSVLSKARPGEGSVQKNPIPREMVVQVRIHFNRNVVNDEFIL